MAKKPYYITTAIAYTSGKPHIGNTYEIVLADSIARYKRFAGYDVRFQTGTDEHGQKIELKAAEAGITPKEFVDKTAGEIQRIWDLMNTSYDKFIRTTDENHERQVQKIFKRLYDKGDIYKGNYEGLYCTPCESFFTESQLVDGKCPDCGREVQPAKEEAYFFKMSKYQGKLIDYINTHPDFIQPESRKNEMMNNFLIPGLQDLCVSRTSFKWGIPVDFDEKHVVYVWIDALTNYITGLGFDIDGGSDRMYDKYWPCDLHLIGKDILRFHTIYWPIMLMALGLPLPKQVFGHPWLLQSDGKMSKSKGNVIYADDLVDMFGVDAVRYFVLHEMPFENDGVISWELVVERLNSDLANTLGNLVNRTVSMSNKYFDGEVNNKKAVEDVDKELIDYALDTRIRVSGAMDKLRVADAITEIFNLFKRCNKYIDETMPWALAKEEDKQDRLATVLYNLVESIIIGATLLEPYMPETAEKILAQLNAPKRKVNDLVRFGGYKSGT
ncbi:MAG: methionine--tRNA ligase, partial [Lachnospiraceae bacterium]|nr:methionine--tRNA ligase [Lachnospiraceae bacterium]